MTFSNLIVVTLESVSDKLLKACHVYRWPSAFLQHNVSFLFRKRSTSYTAYVTHITMVLDNQSGYNLRFSHQKPSLCQAHWEINEMIGTMIYPLYDRRCIVHIKHVNNNNKINNNIFIIFTWPSEARWVLIFLYNSWIVLLCYFFLNMVIKLIQFTLHLMFSTYYEVPLSELLVFILIDILPCI